MKWPDDYDAETVAMSGGTGLPAKEWAGQQPAGAAAEMSDWGVEAIRRNIARCRAAGVDAPLAMERAEELLATLDARTREIERLRDNPDADCTDAAHPAWWRGHDHGFDAAVRVLTLALHEDSPGKLANEAAQALREGIGELRRERDEARQHVGNLLARIFRDGGQTRAMMGDDGAAVRAADREVATLRAVAEEVAAERNAILAALVDRGIPVAKPLAETVRKLVERLKAAEELIEWMDCGRVEYPPAIDGRTDYAAKANDARAAWLSARDATTTGGTDAT